MTTSMDGKIVTIFGGTGFVGRAIIAKLASMGAIIRVVTRTPQSAYFLKPYGRVGQISALACNLDDQNSVDAAVKGSWAVINCLGILFEKGSNTFQKVHVEYADKIARAAHNQSATKFIHISALACDRSQAHYAQTKLEGEAKIRTAFPSAIILRPSVIFGPDDNFFNLFAKLSLISPVLPLIKGGHTKFQPVYVGDVALCAVNTLVQNTKAGIYELGGAEQFTFAQLLEKLNHYTGRNRALMPIPSWLAHIQAAIFSLMPTPLLTKDQITSLDTDNIVSPNVLTMNDLHVTPTAIDAILPTYLDHYKSGGRFAEKKRAS